MHQVLDGMDGDRSGAALDVEYALDTQEPVAVPVDQQGEPKSERAPVERPVVLQDERADAGGVIGPHCHPRAIPRLEPRLDLIQPRLGPVAILQQDEMGSHSAIDGHSDNGRRVDPGAASPARDQPARPIRGQSS